MTEYDTQQLDRIIARMTEAEKRELRAKLDRCLEADPSGTEREATIAARQRQAWERLWQKVRNRPAPKEPDDGLIASRDHDKILYDGSSHTGFPEKPKQ